MKRPLALFLLYLCLGCGKPPPFVNRTPHSTAYLMNQWQGSQKRVATGALQLNPYQPGAQATYSQPEGRAYQVQPSGLLVEAVPDATPEQVFALSGQIVSAPSAAIICPQPCDLKVVQAYSTFKKAAVYYAASLDHDSDSTERSLRYEFDSEILYRLGYDVHWR